ncbi:serine/threonine-protein kinase Chk2 [Trypanosoma grayi]|uniref:serine/threonine-protein kinase Chk2 n=1 Tax=Trypanosoma grayi TaxID=71804 RepID=UPI0004F49535|nr:serine/threonine-protein kinase Chk2 [Trypanosoma grayi]KEG14347.1 serine/threonine-protein kinase Chk2 [Trypanosoma grayi]
MHEGLEKISLRPLGGDGGEVQLSSSLVSFGRDASCCDVVFPDSAGILSRKHCFVRHEGDAVVIEDLSHNGTFINGKRIGKGRQQQLQLGDVLSLMNPVLPDCASFSFLLQMSSTCEPYDVLAGRYVLKEVIGTGAASCVRVGIDCRSGEALAVKTIDARKFSFLSRCMREALVGEADILRALSPHPNIVRFIEVIDVPPVLALVMERGCGDLFDYVVGRRGAERPLVEREVRGLFAQLFDAVRHMHRNHIVHRDLKPENVVLVFGDASFQEHLGEVENVPALCVSLKLADFGSARHRISRQEEPLSPLGCTSAYTAPEVLAAEERGASGEFAADVWSLGAILHFMCFCKPPERGVLELSRTISEECGRLLRGMLAGDPAVRVCLDDVAAHAWMSGGGDSEASGPTKRRRLH